MHVSIGELLILTEVAVRTWWRGEDNIKALLRENEFRVDSSGLRCHFNSCKRMINLRTPYWTGNFEQVLGRHNFERQAPPRCREFDCKQYCCEGLHLGDHRGLYGTVRN